jgi:hypothetical protein
MGEYGGADKNSLPSKQSTEEIQYTIALGNKAYYANQCFFKRRLVTKKSKLKLYWSIIGPTVTYSCEKWLLKETIKKTS